MEINFAPFQCINFGVYVMNKIAKLEESLALAHNLNLHPRVKSSLKGNRIASQNLLQSTNSAGLMVFFLRKNQ